MFSRTVWSMPCLRHTQSPAGIASHTITTNVRTYTYLSTSSYVHVYLEHTYSSTSYTGCTHAPHILCRNNHCIIATTHTYSLSHTQMHTHTRTHAHTHTCMKVIRHAGVDSRMIILDDQARQQMTRHFLIVTSMQRFAHHGLRQAYDEARDGRNVALK